MAPAAIAGMGLAMQMGGAVTGEIARGQAAEAQAQGFDHDAKVNETNAKLVLDQAHFNETKSRVLSGRQLGQMSADFSASGFTRTGSILDVLQSNASLAEADAMNIRRRGQQQSQAYMEEAGFDKYKAAYTRESGAFDWAKVGFQVGGAAAGAYPKMFGNSASATGAKSAVGNYVGEDAPTWGKSIA